MWIELHDSARDHPKTMKIAKDLGIKPVLALGHLASLWTWTLRMAPDGDLSSFDEEDIAIGAQWEDAPGDFTGALVRRELLDETEHGLVVHDWEEYAEHLKARERKRRERERKRDRKREMRLKGQGNPDTSHPEPGNPDVSRDTAGNPDVSRRPTDRPDRPDQTDRKKEEGDSPPLRGVVSLPLNPGPVGEFSDRVEAVKAHYVAQYPGRDAVASGAERLILARLKEDYSVADLCRAIDGFAGDDWCRKQGRTDLRLMMKNRGKIGEGIALGDKPRKVSGISEKSQRTVDNMQEWLDEEEAKDNEQHR